MNVTPVLFVSHFKCLILYVWVDLLEKSIKAVPNHDLLDLYHYPI